MSLHLGAVEVIVGEADRYHEEEGGEAADLLPPAVAEVTAANAKLQIFLQQTDNVHERNIFVLHFRIRFRDVHSLHRGFKI